MSSKPSFPENIFLSDAEFDMNSEMISLYHRIATRISNAQGNLLLFISSSQGEGTTMCARAFASAAATSLGLSVLLLKTGSNTNKAVEARYTDLERCLTRKAPLDKTDFYKTGSDYFEMVFSHRGSTISEVFSAPTIDGVCDELRAHFDLVILDSPAASMRDNGVDIAYKMDGVILIIEAENTRVTLVRDVINRIVKVNGNILGTVLNKRRFYIPETIYRKL